MDERDVVPLSVALAPEVSPLRMARRWRELRDGLRHVMVAEVEGHVAGTVSMGGCGHQRTGSLRAFALDVGEAFRRRGLGTALLSAVEDEARRRGLHSVNLEVATANTNAVHLYERLGYVRDNETIVDRWERLATDGSREQIEEDSYVMVKVPWSPTVRES